MTLRKCPHCVQLTHFDEGERAPMFCWNCAARVDFGALPTPAQKLLGKARSACDRVLPDPSRLVGAGKVALVVAVPVAALMLLICNSFDLFVVHDALAPFVRP